MRRIVYSLAFLLGVFARPLVAQAPGTTDKPTLYTFVDTTNVAAVAPDIYVTWIYAASVPHPTPMVSSAILVAFDCKARKVARLNHIVYHLNADSSGVRGMIEDDPGTWVDVSVPKTFDLVCSVGATRPYDPEQGTVTAPTDTPKPEPSSLYPVS